MKKLYVCEYPYVLFKALIDRVSDDQNSYSLILSDSFIDMKPMVPVLKQSGLFERVEFFPSEPYRDYYGLYFFDALQSRLADTCKRLKNNIITLLYQKKFKEIEFPFEIDFKEYDKIICNDLACVINSYLSMNHIEYAMSEHAKNYYQVMSKPYDLYLRLLNNLDRLHIICGKPPASRFCTEIIVNDAERVVKCIRHKKVTAWNVDEHIGALTEQQKDQIFQWYADAYGIQIDVNQKYDLLLANPLYSKKSNGTAYLPSEQKQIEFYKDFIRDYSHFPVLIKPHPRDTVDYCKHFPECTVIDHSIPSEVLNFSSKLKLDSVLTLFSSSTSSFQSKADKIIVLESDSTHPSQMVSLQAYR